MHLTRATEIAQVAAQVPVKYMVFDILWLDGHDLTELSYLQRRKLLTELVEPGEGWLVPAHHVDGAADLLGGPGPASRRDSGQAGRQPLPAGRPKPLVAQGEGAAAAGVRHRGLAGRGGQPQWPARQHPGGRLRG